MENLIDKKNELLKRREVEFVVESDSNPGFEGAKKLVVENFNVGEDVVVVRAVRSRFGSNGFHIEAFIYNSADDLAKIEPRKKEKKSGGSS